MTKEGFFTDLRTAELFYRFCSRYHIDNPSDRILVMRNIVRRKKALYIRDIAPLLEGNRAVVIKRKEVSE